MDELKLEKWKKSFAEQSISLKVKYETYLPAIKFEETYHLELNESQSLVLIIDSLQLPKEIIAGLEDILLKTEPEDSI